jgi:hypothetical protein
LSDADGITRTANEFCHLTDDRRLDRQLGLFETVRLCRPDGD